MRKKSIILEGINGLSIDSVIDKYIERQTTFVIVDDMHTDENGAWAPIVDEIAPKHKPSRAVLYPKFQALIHIIISKCMANRENRAYLNEKRYTKVFGRSFSEMLYTLKEMGVIAIGYYKVGINSRPLSINAWDIIEYETYSSTILKLIDKIKGMDYENKHKEESIPNNEFINHYNSSLSLLRLTRKENAIELINTINKNEHRYHYYHYCISSFSNNAVINSIDMNGRIYHYLTNLPRELKQFFNIKYQLDIHNSHPLLFNYYLIKEYKISNNLINNILLYKQASPPNILNGMQSFHNLLKDSKLQNNVGNDIPEDVLLYIYLTSKGIFWDFFCSDSGNREERSEIKEKMFAEVFYSDGVASQHYKYAKMFAKVFPSVWRLITAMKNNSKGISLPNRMMRIESELMKRILTQLYNQNYEVVSIHDAVIVLDVEANNGFDIDEAVKIMEEVYREYDLFPSVDITTYH